MIYDPARKWRLQKNFGHWCLYGQIYHTFDTWEDAIEWIETQRYSEPS